MNKYLNCLKLLLFSILITNGVILFSMEHKEHVTIKGFVNLTDEPAVLRSGYNYVEVEPRSEKSIDFQIPYNKQNKAYTFVVLDEEYALLYNSKGKHDKFKVELIGRNPLRIREIPVT